jgi:hypothetical protein
MAGGRPRKYDTKEELQEKIDKYFYESTHNEDDTKKDEPDPITMSGLAFYLGFADRQSITDYKKTDEFTFTIKRAKLRIENYLEARLLGNNVTGIIFNLKNNFGWKDKSEFGITPGTDEDGNKMKWEVEFIRPEDKKE